MNREWTYRPPLLVGERIVWLGGSAGLGETEPCDYGPHHGTVSWIGRVSDMGPSWTVGIDFETDMTGGCDGAWKGRHIFTCKPGQGLFLPVISLIKDDDFYGSPKQLTTTATHNNTRKVAALATSTALVSNMDKPQATLDISLAPEPPPPKVRSPSAPSYEIHTRNYLKRSGPDMDPSVYYALGGAGPSDKRQPRSPNQAKDKGSSSFSTSVVTSCVSSSPAATTSTTIYSSSVCSSTTYTSKEMIAGKFTHKGPQDTSQNSRKVGQETLAKKESVESPRAGKNAVNSEYEDWSETGGYFGETMIRKSSLSSSSGAREFPHRLGQSVQSSVSTPSSPNLGDYQRNYGTKSSVGVHNSMDDVGKRLASPSVSSFGDKPHLQREKSGGFLNIFRWFRNRDRKKRATSIDRMSTNSGGSVNSLTSATSSFAYIPIMRSKSADNNKKMVSKRGSECGVSSHYKLFSKESSLEGLKFNSRDEELSKRLSTISASSDASSKGGSRSTTVSRKKRPAPQPPGSPKTSESGSIKSHKSCTSLPSRDLKPTTVSDVSSAEVKFQGQDGRKLQKSKSEGLIYSKTKRRAPLPPVHLVAERMKAEKLNEQREAPKKRQAPAVPAKRGNRPVSNVSSISSLSQSPSSTSTTLKSHSSSVASSETASSLYSSESFRLESGYLKQDIKSSSSPSIPEATKLTLSPRPWYKRKKKQNKENTKDLKDDGRKERVYESWMPDIQFSRSKLSLSGSFKMGKSSDEDTLKKSKEDEKREKRKSQVSLLANISELDRAASEQMQRELEEKKARKEMYDSKFYKSSEPHILTQTDFLPSTSELSDLGTLSSIGTSSTLNSLTSRTETEQELSHTEEVSISSQSYTEHATLKLEERNRSLVNGSTISHSSSPVGSDHHIGAVGFEPSDDDSTPSPPVRPSRESPMQRAAFDAELFYKLAKDTQSTSGSKVKTSPVLSGNKDQKKQQNDEHEDLMHESILSQFRKQSKNFGLRMNNFFSPDVSTIIEASESMTSSATTPADDIYDDLPVPSSIGGCARRDSVLDELHSEINYDLRLNSTSEAREIMQELADVRKEIAKINQQEEEAAKVMEKKKKDKIRDEVLLLREKDNFELWQNVVRNTCTGNQMVEVSPLPIDIESNERKMKWVCDVCTLINLPWRLQCEACMSRRPSNPKRVDEDGKSGTNEHTSSQPSASDESPITVIHEDENTEGVREAADADVVIPSQIPGQGIESQPVDDKKKRDINWERELRKYFMTFDEHVRGVSDTGECSQSKAAGASENEAAYGKITRNSKTAKASQENNASGKGAKPKTKKAPEDGALSNAHVDGAMDDMKDFEVDPDIEELRKARTAKFTAGASAFESMEMRENAAGNEVTSPERKSSKKNGTAKKKLGSKGKKSKSLDKEYYKESNDQITESTVTLSLTNGSPEQPNGAVANEPSYSSLPNEDDNQEDRTFYSKNYRKPQVLKPSGVVNNVVSIFNQLEQLQHVKEKSKVTRRRSFSNVMGRTQAFEQMNSLHNSPELLRSQKTFKESPSFPRKNDLMKDKDIVSAIAKFDEMAAMAEVEKIDKKRVKNELSRRRPKFTNIFSSKMQSKPVSGSENQINKSGTANGAQGTTSLQPDPAQSSSRTSSGKPPHDSKFSVHSSDSSDGIVKDGVLHTEMRKRSMSIGSGTFELIQAKDFESIEAQISETSSPLESKSITSPTLSPSSGQPSMVVPQIVIDPVQDQVSPSSVTNNYAVSASHTGNEKDEQSRVEKQEVERLSRQLTVAGGIANFKASLKVVEPDLGQMNTLSINRLLRRLEAAISRGKHAEAAKLAHELAELRVSCSVVRNPRDKTSADKGGNSSSPRAYDDSYYLSASGNEAEASRTYTPNSNISECFYDACEKLENEELDDQYDRGLMMANVNTEVNGVLPERMILQDASRLDDHLSEVRSPKGSAAPLQMSASAHSLSSQKAAASNAQGDYTVVSSKQMVSKDSCSSAHMREIRVDPARREVKSDTISRLPDEPVELKKDFTIADLPFNVKMYVEDKNSHQGPIRFAVVASMTVGDLREKVCQDFGFPPEFQRWILGRRLADDDSQTLSQHKVTAEGCPIFMYLVAPESEPQSHGKAQTKDTAYAKYSINQSSSHSSLASSGHDHEQLYSAEVVKPKFYNPDSQRYEISLETDYSDLNDDDTSSDNEDTLKENDVDMYQNFSNTEEKIPQSGQSAYGSVSQENMAIERNAQIYQPRVRQDSNRMPQNPADIYNFEKPSASYADASGPISIPVTSHQVVNKPVYDKINQEYAIPDLKKVKPANPTYTNVDELAPQQNVDEQAPQQNETIYQSSVLQEQMIPHSSAQQSGHQEQSQNGQTQNDVAEKLYDSKQQKTPELQKQKQLILELKHQHHYMQVPLVKQVAPESHSVQSMSHQESRHNPQVSSDVSKPQESYYDLQQQATPLIPSKQDQQEYESVAEPVNLAPPIDFQQQPQQITTNEPRQVTQEKLIQIPTPSRSSSLNHKLVQANQSQHSPNYNQVKPSKSQQTPQSQATVSTALPSQPSENQYPKLQLQQPLQHQTQNVKQSESTPQYSQLHQKPANQPSAQQQTIQPPKQPLVKQTGSKQTVPQSSVSQPPPVQESSTQPQSPEGEPEKAQEPVPIIPSKLQGWVCPSCTFVNKWARPGCEVCATERPANESAEKTSGIGAAMSALERQGCVPSLEPFECRVCFLDISVGDGVVLRDCLHTFCRDCLSNAIKFSDTAEVKCPYRDNQYSCDSSLQDREIKTLLNPQEYEKHLNKSVKQAEGAMQNVFHCKTPDCPGFCQFEDNVNLFHCDVCERTNCLTCQAQHENKTCQEYQDDLAQKVDEAALKTKKFFDDMIRRGDGLPCPKCSVMLVRKWGCDWMRCPMCRTEICWVTRGPRWGPGGTGDVTGGCKCGIRGRKCHPKCTYCH